MTKEKVNGTIFIVIIIVVFFFQNTGFLSSSGSYGRVVVSNPQLFSVYFGGHSVDKCTGIAIDSSDNIIVIGNTRSIDFPVLNASYSTYNGFTDAFIAKFSSTGILIWSTFFGGSYGDSGYDIAVDSQDNIIITGSSSSSDFPILNPYNTSLNSSIDAIVAKFSPLGTLIWSTYLGGSGVDVGLGVGVDSLDNIIITGHTKSNDFPGINTSSITISDSLNIFVVKFSSAGMLEWSTLLGGQNLDTVNGIAIDSQDKPIITGYTRSADFPTLNAFDNTFNSISEDDADVFVTKLNYSGELEWSTFCGGKNIEYSHGIAVDDQNNIVITGETSSNDFPTLDGYQKNIFTYSNDAFVTKFSSIGEMKWSTFLGGWDWDIGVDLEIDSQNDIIVSGFSDSQNFPVSNAFDSTYNESDSGFITKFTASGDYKWSSFLGGIGGHYLRVAIDSQDYFIIFGHVALKTAEGENDWTNSDCLLFHMLDPLLDTDSDSIPDYWEYRMDFDPNNPLDAGLDFDSDGLTNLQEFLHGLDPNNPDYDNDGALDGEELDQILLDPKNSFFNPITRFVAIFFFLVLPGLLFIILSFRWKQQKRKEN